MIIPSQFAQKIPIFCHNFATPVIIIARSVIIHKLSQFLGKLWRYCDNYEHKCHNSSVAGWSNYDIADFCHNSAFLGHNSFIIFVTISEKNYHPAKCHYFWVIIFFRNCDKYYQRIVTRIITVMTRVITVIILVTIRW